MYDRTEDSIFPLMIQVMRLSKDSVDQALQECDLKPWQAGIIFVLSKSGGLSQRELAAKLHQTPSTVTSAIQKMEKLGYIERKPDEHDQRVIRLNVTEKSKAYMDAVLDMMNMLEDTMMKGMSMEEKLLLRRFLLHMKDNIEDYNKGKGRKV